MVDDQINKPTWAHKILEFDPHREEQVCKEILPALTSDFAATAQRPLFSALDCSLFEYTFNLKLPGWQMLFARQFYDLNNTGLGI